MIDLKNRRAETIERGPMDQRVETLERIVVDLMMEIEALRSAMITLVAPSVTNSESSSVLEESPGGVSGEHNAYGKAYLKTAWLSHWSAGQTSGRDKLVEEFYGDADSHSSDWRETQMLRRLGYTAEQVAEYVDHAQAAEICT